ncbi:unnamed protein product, partial [Brassica oleracea var. botrytis]
KLDLLLLLHTRLVVFSRVLFFTKCCWTIVRFCLLLSGSFVLTCFQGFCSLFRRQNQ